MSVRVISLIDVGAFELPMQLPMYLFNHVIRDFLTMLVFLHYSSFPLRSVAKCHGDRLRQGGLCFLQSFSRTPILNPGRGRRPMIGPNNGRWKEIHPRTKNLFALAFPLLPLILFLLSPFLTPSSSFFSCRKLPLVCAYLVSVMVPLLAPTRVCLIFNFFF